MSDKQNTHSSAAGLSLTRLQSEALLEVSGPDAVNFLHNQASCDIRQLNTGRACYGSFCNPQGRVLADFIALAVTADTLLLRLQRDILARTLESLGRFAVFSKVTLRDATEDWELWGLQGENWQAALREHVAELPEDALDWTAAPGTLLLRPTTDPQALELWVRVAAEEALAEALMTQSTSQPDEEKWQAANLRQGIARLQSTTSGEFLPQQLNYDLCGHINFRKGCYPGQEVIARMHYKGKAKRRMLLMTLPADADLQAGAPVYRAGQDQAAGAVINTALASDEERLVLVTTTATAAEDGLYTAPEASVPLQVLTLPYSVPFG